MYCTIVLNPTTCKIVKRIPWKCFLQRKVTNIMGLACNLFVEKKIRRIINFGTKGIIIRPNKRNSDGRYRNFYLSICLYRIYTLFFFIIAPTPPPPPSSPEVIWSAHKSNQINQINDIYTLHVLCLRIPPP